MADELVLLLDESLIVDIRLTAKDNMSLSSSSQSLDVWVHFLCNFGERAFDLTGDQVVAKGADCSAHAVCFFGAHNGGVGMAVLRSVATVELSDLRLEPTPAAALSRSLEDSLGDLDKKHRRP